MIFFSCKNIVLKCDFLQNHFYNIIRVVNEKKYNLVTIIRQI